MEWRELLIESGVRQTWWSYHSGRNAHCHDMLAKAHTGLPTVFVYWLRFTWWCPLSWCSGHGTHRSVHGHDVLAKSHMVVPTVVVRWPRCTLLPTVVLCWLVGHRAVAPCEGGDIFDSLSFSPPVFVLQVTHVSDDRTLKELCLSLVFTYWSNSVHRSAENNRAISDFWLAKNEHSYECVSFENV